jgi:hypothetical protein
MSIHGLLFTGWLEIMIMCPSGRHVYPRLLFTGWLEIMIMCPSGRHVHPRTVVYWLARNHDNVSEWASCLSTDYCLLVGSKS